MTISTLQTKVRFLTGAGTDTYTDAEIKSNLTDYARDFNTEILNAQDEWDFNGEIAPADLEDDKEEYVFPTDLLTIKRIEVSYDGTDWYKATIWDSSERSDKLSDKDDFSKDDPYVDIFDNSLFLYPTPDADVTGGLKIWYSEGRVGKSATGTDITSFSADTDIPSLVEAFQKGLIWGACKDWAHKYQEWDKARAWDGELQRVIEKMKTFYGSRIQDRRVIIKTASDLENY